MLAMLHLRWQIVIIFYIVSFLRFCLLFSYSPTSCSVIISILIRFHFMFFFALGCYNKNKSKSRCIHDASISHLNSVHSFAGSYKSNFGKSEKIEFKNNLYQQIGQMYFCSIPSKYVWLKCICSGKNNSRMVFHQCQQAYVSQIFIIHFDIWFEKKKCFVSSFSLVSFSFGFVFFFWSDTVFQSVKQFGRQSLFHLFCYRYLAIHNNFTYFDEEILGQETIA